MIRKRVAAAVLLGTATLGCNAGEQAAEPAPPAVAEDDQPLSVPDDALVTYRGRGGTTTRAFKVSDNWELHWDSTHDEPIRVDLLVDGGKAITLVDAQGRRPPSGGVVGSGDGGRYRLRIRTEGRWAVGVVEP